MAQGVQKYVKAPIENGIEAVQMGVLGESPGGDNLIGPVREPPRRKPARAGIEKHQHQQAKNKSREGKAHNAEDPGQLIKPFVVVDRSQDTQPNADAQNRDKTPQGQFQRGGETAQQHIDHRLAPCAGIAQITPQHTAHPLARIAIHCAKEPVDILDVKRLVQAVAFDDAVHLIFVFGNILNIKRCPLYRRHKKIEHSKNQQRDTKDCYR